LLLEIVRGYLNILGRVINIIYGERFKSILWKNIYKYTTKTKIHRYRYIDEMMALFSDWFRPPVKIGFDDMLFAIRDTTNGHIIINTLPATNQECLIERTVPIDTEEGLINTILTQYDNPPKKIILYGKNSTDATVDKKYKQLVGLGFTEVYVYSGGLFEWMLLQDIYGDAEFPTTKKVADILRYKPTPTVYNQTKQTVK